MQHWTLEMYWPASFGRLSVRLKMPRRMAHLANRPRSRSTRATRLHGAPLGEARLVPGSKEVSGGAWHCVLKPAANMHLPVPEQARRARNHRYVRKLQEGSLRDLLK